MMHHYVEQAAQLAALNRQKTLNLAGHLLNLTG
jgi:hypothetical protein